MLAPGVRICYFSFYAIKMFYLRYLFKISFFCAGSAGRGEVAATRGTQAGQSWTQDVALPSGWPETGERSVLTINTISR
jgi:hypothetical protein